MEILAANLLFLVTLPQNQLQYLLRLVLVQNLLVVLKSKVKLILGMVLVLLVLLAIVNLTEPEHILAQEHSLFSKVLPKHSLHRHQRIPSSIDSLVLLQKRIQKTLLVLDQYFQLDHQLSSDLFLLLRIQYCSMFMELQYQSLHCHIMVLVHCSHTENPQAV